MYEHYIISFENVRTGEFKEYYLFVSPEDIEERAKELRNKFFKEEDIIKIHVYKRVDTYYADDITITN